MKKELLKSPLNYTGNKYRIIEQISQFFPKQVNCMIDLFCGGATVGLNVDAKKVIFVDSNERVINLLVYLSKQTFDDFMIKCEEIIAKYNLSYSYKYGYQEYRNKCQNLKDNNGLKDYNSAGFYKLKNDYNELNDKTTDYANQMLYMLMVYAFNNDIRFNSDGLFNLPIGKTDLNKMNVEKIKNYINKVQSMETEFLCMSFIDEKFEKYVSMADFIYMDPPYLIGNAVYNSSWNYVMEYKLLDFIDSLMERKINFALSNVIEKVGKTNEPLSYWCHKNNDKIIVNHINYHYRSASYNKIDRNAREQEVLIANKEYNHENK
ncbi:MAG: DNA adenine methylase [Anaeroplasma sp.]|nr:DNA adenine methylase [Anaeroplasma sp.]